MDKEAAEAAAKRGRADSSAAVHQAQSNHPASVVAVAAIAFPVPKVSLLWFRVWARECWDSNWDPLAESIPGSTASHRPSRSSARFLQTVFYIGGSTSFDLKRVPGG